MKPQVKFVIKIWCVMLGLSLATSLAIKFSNSSELVLLFRLFGTAFFIILYRYVSNMIKKQQEIIKSSHGFAQQLFDPNYLKITLLLSILGWTTFAVMEYIGINQVDWLMTFIVMVIVFPFVTGKIPIRLHDNKNWRRK